MFSPNRSFELRNPLGNTQLWGRIGEFAKRAMLVKASGDMREKPQPPFYSDSLPIIWFPGILQATLVEITGARLWPRSEL